MWEVLQRKDKLFLGDANLEDFVFIIYSRLWEKWRNSTVPFISFTGSFLKLASFSCLFYLSDWLVGCFSWGEGGEEVRSIFLPMDLLEEIFTFLLFSFHLLWTICRHHSGFFSAFLLVDLNTSFSCGLCMANSLLFFLTFLRLFCCFYSNSNFHEILNQISLFKFGWHQYFFSLLPEFPCGYCLSCGIKQWGQQVSDQAQVFSILICSSLFCELSSYLHSGTTVPDSAQLS